MSTEKMQDGSLHITWPADRVSQFTMDRDDAGRITLRFVVEPEEKKAPEVELDGSVALLEQRREEYGRLPEAGQVTLGLVLQQRPRLHAERSGQLLQSLHVDTTQRLAGQDVCCRGLGDSCPLGELVGGSPPLPFHVALDVPADHGAKDSDTKASLTSSKAWLSIPAI